MYWILKFDHISLDSFANVVLLLSGLACLAPPSVLHVETTGLDQDLLEVIPYPMGLPHLLPHDMKKVKEGNLLLEFSYNLIVECNRYNVPWALENPGSSRCWLTPLLKKLSSSADFCILDFCQFGEPWKKQTAILHKGVWLINYTAPLHWWWQSLLANWQKAPSSKRGQPFWIFLDLGSTALPFWTGWSVEQLSFWANFSPERKRIGEDQFEAGSHISFSFHVRKALNLMPDLSMLCIRNSSKQAVVWPQKMMCEDRIMATTVSRNLMRSVIEWWPLHLKGLAVTSTTPPPTNGEDQFEAGSHISFSFHVRKALNLMPDLSMLCIRNSSKQAVVWPQKMMCEDRIIGLISRFYPLIGGSLWTNPCPLVEKGLDFNLFFCFIYIIIPRSFHDEEMGWKPDFKLAQVPYWSNRFTTEFTLDSRLSNSGFHSFLDAMPVSEEFRVCVIWQTN